MNIVNAKDIIMKVRVDGDDIDIGCAASLIYRYKNEIIGKTDVNAGLFRKKRVRISDYSASVQGLITLSNEINGVSCFYFLQEAIRRTEQYITFIYTDEIGQIRTIAANYLVESEDLSGGAEKDFGEFDLNLEGTGDLTLSTIDSPPAGTCFETDSDWWSTTPGANSITGLGNAGKTFAGQQIIAVIREGGIPLQFTSGTPGERDYSYDGTTITTWASNPYLSGEKIYVLWQAVV